MKIITLNWGGKGTGSIDALRQDIEDNLVPCGYHFVHVYESGQPSVDNYIRLSNWFESRVYYVLAQLTGNRYGTGYLPYLRFKNIVKKNKPDIVHIHCPNGYAINLYKVLRFLGKEKMPTVITNHAEFFYTGGCAHAKECVEFQTKCLNCVEYKRQCNSRYINRTKKNWEHMYQALHSIPNLMMVGVSPWVLERMNRSSIAKDLKKCVIENGINTNVFYYDIVDKQTVFRRILDDVSDEVKKKIEYADKIYLHVTSSFSVKKDDLKGGYYFLELAQKNLYNKVLFVVAGNVNVSSVQLTEFPPNVLVLGKIDNQKILADLYRISDATLITSMRETYGMTCAESLCCGTPVVGFENGGSDSVALKEGSSFVEYGNIIELQNALNYITNLNVDRKALSQKARERYTTVRMAREYGELYQSMYERRCGKRI